MALSLDMVTTVLAQEGPRQTGPDFGKASPFGLIVVVLLLIGTFGLVWSMNRHLRRLPKSFDTEDSKGPGSTGENPIEGATGVESDIATEPPGDGARREPG